MILKCVTYLSLTCILLASCSDSNPLDAVVQVVDHSDCSNNIAVLKLTATGGTAPYIFQIRQKIDNKIVHTEVSDEKEILVELPNLNTVFYEMEVIDDLFVSFKTKFEVRPLGFSTISDVLHLEEQGILYPMDKVEVTLHSIEDVTEIYETVYTDRYGRFTFKDIPSGLYSISIFILEKYSGYHMEVLNGNGHIRLSPERNSTLPFSINCRIPLDADFVFMR